MPGSDFRLSSSPSATLRQIRLDCGAQGLVINRARQAACQARGELLEGHDLDAVLAFPRGGESQFAHRQPPVGDDGPPS